MDEHEIVAALKRAASELGHTPTRDEFIKLIDFSYERVRERFRTFSTLVQAAGLSPAKSKRITNEIFTKNVEAHLSAYVPVEPPKREKPWPKIASISDIHWPFSRKRTVDAFLDFIELHQPNYVVLNGDAWDMFSHGKFPRSHNVFTPREERDLALRMNREFWVEVKKRCPKAICVQMLGNHDLRPMKRLLDSYPAAEDWLQEALTRDFTFDGVKTMMDYREELVIQDIAIFHGYRSQLGSHRDYTMFNCVNGHSHLGGAVFRQVRGQVLWELNSGLAGDPFAKGLTYTPQKITHWTPGFGWVDQYGPRFIPVWP